MKKIAVGNIGEEELSRLVIGRHSLGDVEGSLKVLFGEQAVKNMKSADLEKIKKLFTTAGANLTQAPNLTKEAKAKNVVKFFEKLSAAAISDAQRRYPELLKIASSASISTPSSTTSSTPTPALKPPTALQAQRKIPAQSMMSGGAP